MCIGGNFYKLNLASYSFFQNKMKLDTKKSLKLYIMQNNMNYFAMYNVLCISDWNT